MHIYFDLDHTIIDDTGKDLRPGILELFEWCLGNSIRISLWTGSTEERSRDILEKLHLYKFFSHLVFREDYDPDRIGLGKNINYQDGDLLVDDDPKQITYVESLAKKGYKLSKFTSIAQPPPTQELGELKSFIEGMLCE